MQKTIGRIPYIEGLRGILALVVLVHHYMVAFFPAAYWGEALPTHLLWGLDVALSQSPLGLWYAGNLAVCFFFLLCAYVIGLRYFRSGELHRMAFTRYPRLALPVLATSLLVYACMRLSLFWPVPAAQLTGSGWLDGLYRFEPDLPQAVKTALFDVMFLGNAQYNTVFWTVQVLLIGAYLTYLFLLLLGRARAQDRAVAYLCAAALALALNKPYYLAFILGALLADPALCRPVPGRRRVPALALLLGVYLGGYPTGVVPPTTPLYRWLDIGAPSFSVYHVLAAFLLFWALLSSRRAKGMLSSKPLVLLGKLSFPLYLMHILVLCSFSCWLFLRLYEALGKYQLAFALMFAASLPVQLAVAALFSLLERGLRRLTGYFYARLLGPAPAPCRPPAGSHPQ